MASSKRRENRLLSSADLDDCRKAVDIIKHERVVALATVDANRDWPITILLVGTLDGNVYVFDVLENGKEQNKNFFKDIGLDEVLTSSDITKVMYGCNVESAALFFQFGIKLSSVFDIQVAEGVIQENKGRLVIPLVNPWDLHIVYTGQGVEWKRDIQLKWMKTEGNFWAKRPLAQEKIDHECYRVSLFIEETYKAQQRYLEENCLLEKFQECVQEELDSNIFEKQNECKYTRFAAKKKEVLEGIVKNCLDRQAETVLNDRDKRFVFDSTYIRDILQEGYPDIIIDLKLKGYGFYLVNILERGMDSPATFHPNSKNIKILNDMTMYGSVPLKDRAARVKKRFLDIFANNLQKYGTNASVEDLSRHDTGFIRELRPYDDSWSYPNVIMDLYWGVVENDIDKNRENMYARWMWVGSINTLMFYLDHPNITLSVRRKIKDIVDAVKERLPQKYGMQSTADDVDDLEKAVLGTLDVTGNAYGPVVERLYWEVAYAMLCDKSKVIKVNQRFPNRIKFLATDNKVPRAVQRKANEILRGLLPLRHF